MNIGSLNFKNKTEAIKYFTNYLRTHDNINYEDINDIKAMISLHPKIIEQNQDFIPYIDFSIKCPRQKCFWIRYENREIDDICIKKCFEGYNILNEISIKMRELITEQINIYKNTHNEYVCQKCKIKTTLNNIHVDHYQPQFHVLRDTFIKISGLNLNEILKKLNENIDTQQQWIQYHNDNATLRYLCKFCNQHRKRNE